MITLEVYVELSVAHFVQKTQANIGQIPQQYRRSAMLANQQRGFQNVKFELNFYGNDMGQLRAMTGKVISLVRNDVRGAEISFQSVNFTNKPGVILLELIITLEYIEPIMRTVPRRWREEGIRRGVIRN